MNLTLMSLAFTIPLALGSVHAQPTPARPSPQDASAIDTLVASLTEAWNRGDAHAFASRYAQDGSFTNIIGMTLFGREGFEQQHHTIFTTIYKGSTVAFKTDRIQLIRPDVAVVDCTSRLAGVSHFPPGISPGADGVLTTKLQLVLTREAGQWWIAAFHNVAVTQLPPQR